MRPPLLFKLLPSSLLPLALLTALLTPTSALRITPLAPLEPSPPGLNQPSLSQPSPIKPSPIKPGPAQPTPSSPDKAAQTKPVQASPAQSVPAPAVPGPAAPYTATPTDPLYARQWNLDAINMRSGWAVTGAQAITVAVLDTGYVDDPELSGRVTNGYDFVSDPGRSGDGDGRDADASGVGQFRYHGEGVANIIGAARDAQGMAGINPLARIVAVRVGGEDGMISVPDLIDGMRWAAGLRVAGAPLNTRPARIINLSLYADFIPLTGCDARVQKAVDEVTARGVLVVAGAANDHADSALYSPAGCQQVLSVAATNRAGRRANYSNYGAAVALAAPGGEDATTLVFSSVDGPQTRNGTSFSAPQVTGVASLMMGLNPNLTPAQVTEVLKQSARPFVGGQCDPDPARSCGAGVLDAGAALRAARAALGSSSSSTNSGGAMSPLTPAPSPSRAPR
ncbi:S8 family serine peptidase [Deinococcus sp.]|uniref:S8 family serine peptidase n=1 Tax=Deinococcus sp. TaxID=47478 RepID=UPI0025E4FF7C|nr:S8 family serine peptidase [Deinococcus sp.]